MSYLGKSFLGVTLSMGILATGFSVAQPAISLKQAQHVTKLRQSVFKLLGSRMGALAAMTKGKIPFDVKEIENRAVHINQLSMMIADYSRIDTSKFDVKTEALAKVWLESAHYNKDIKKLTLASEKLITAAKANDEVAIKKAIRRVGKTCGGCHHHFKAE